MRAQWALERCTPAEIAEELELWEELDQLTEDHRGGVDEYVLLMGRVNE